MSGVTFERQKMKDSSGASQAALVVKNPPANAEDIKRFDPGLGRSLEKEMAIHSSILGLENPMDRRAWRATGHSVAKSQIQLK